MFATETTMLTVWHWALVTASKVGLALGVASVVHAGGRGAGEISGILPSLELGRHVGQIDQVVSGPNDSWLTAGRDGTLRIWSSDGIPLAVDRFDPSGEFGGHVELDSVAILGGRVAVGQKGEVAQHLWLVDNTKTDHVDDPGKWPVAPDATPIRLAASPDGSVPDALVASLESEMVASDGGVSLSLLDPVNARLVDSVPALSDAKGAYYWIRSLSADPSSNRIAYVVDSADPALRWIGYAEARSHKLSRLKPTQLPGNLSPLKIALGSRGLCAVVLPDKIEMGSFGSEAKDLVEKRITFSHAEAKISSVAWSPDGDTLAVASTLGDIVLCDKDGNQGSQALKGDDYGVVSLAFSVGGKRIAYGSSDARLRIWDLASSEPEPTSLQPIPPFASEDTTLEWSKSGRVLRWKGYRGKEVFFDLIGGQPCDRGRFESDQTPSPVPAVPKSRVEVLSTLASLFSDTGKAALDAKNGSFSTDANQAVVLADSPPSAVVAYDEGLLLLGGDPHHAYHCTCGVSSLWLSPNRQFFAAACDDDFIRVYSTDPTVQDGYPLASIFVAPKSEHDADPDGEWIAWNEATGIYCSSIAGDKIFGYQKSGGENSLALFQSAKELKQSNGTSSFRNQRWLMETLFPEESAIDSLLLSKAAVLGGHALSGTVTINPPAHRAVLVKLDVSDPPIGVISNNSVWIQEGQSSATFPISTTAVATDKPIRITASLNGSQTATATVQAPRLLSFTTSQRSIAAGGVLTGTITLDSPAPESGLSISLTSSPSLAKPFPNVIVPRDQISFPFTIQTDATDVDKSVAITATLNGTALPPVSLEVKSLPSLTGVKLASSVLSNTEVQGSVTIDSPAPEGGVVVKVHSDNPAVTPADQTVPIPVGASSAPFTVRTADVKVTTAVNIVAEYNGVTKSWPLNVTFVSAIASVTLNPSTPQPGGVTITATITLDKSPESSLPVTLSISPANSTLTSNVSSVQPGSTTTQFKFTTAPVVTLTTVTITATTPNGPPQSVTLAVVPPAIQSLKLSPNSVEGGKDPVTGTIVLDSPAPDGLKISVTSDLGGVSFGSGGGSVPVPAGQTQVNFQISTSKVGTDGTAKITATLNGSSTPADLLLKAQVIVPPSTPLTPSPPKPPQVAGDHPASAQALEHPTLEIVDVTDESGNFAERQDDKGLVWKVAGQSANVKIRVKFAGGGGQYVLRAFHPFSKDEGDIGLTSDVTDNVVPLHASLGSSPDIIEVQARNKLNEVVSTLQVKITRPDFKDTTLRTVHVISIGVDLLNLQYAESDAKKFADAISDQSRKCSDVLKIAEPKLLTGSNATLLNIRKALADVKSECKDNVDRVIIFVSTHGAVRHEGGDNKGFVLLYGFDPDKENFSDATLSWDELVLWAKSCGAHDVSIFADTCHSGMAAASLYNSKSESPLDSLSRADLPLQLAASCRPNQSSWEGTSNGVFTEALIDAFGEDQTLIRTNPEIQLDTILQGRLDFYTHRRMAEEVKGVSDQTQYPQTYFWPSLQQAPFLIPLLKAKYVPKPIANPNPSPHRPR